MSNLNFIIQNENGLVFIPDRYFASGGKRDHRRWVVITGEIQKGELAEGDPIKLKIPFCEEFITETVVRIERNKEQINYAVKNEVVGIQLSSTGLRELRKFIEG